MFWDSYRMEITTDDSELRTLLSTEAWARGENRVLVGRNRELGEVAELAFPSLSPFPEHGRLKMRALYLSISDPRPWDRIVLWFRKWGCRIRLLNPLIGVAMWFRSRPRQMSSVEEAIPLVKDLVPHLTKSITKAINHSVNTASSICSRLKERCVACQPCTPWKRSPPPVLKS